MSHVSPAKPLEQSHCPVVALQFVLRDPNELQSHAVKGETDRHYRPFSTFVHKEVVAKFSACLRRIGCRWMLDENVRARRPSV